MAATSRSLLDSEEQTIGSAHRFESKGREPELFERRSEARYPAQDPAEIEVLPGPSTPIYATVVDVSRSGMRIALPQHLDRGTQIKVSLHNNALHGEVRYCREVPGGFQAGIKIKDLVLPDNRETDHIADDPLSLYAVGKGLAVTEIIQVRAHLARCESCRARLAEWKTALNPARKVRPSILRPNS